MPRKEISATAPASPVQKKEPAYPYYPFAKALDVAKAVKDAGGNRAEIPKAVLANALNQQLDSPALAQLIATAKAFGMIQGWGTYQLTETANRYFFPQIPSDTRKAELILFAKPAAFKQLIERFDGNGLPTQPNLSNILMSLKLVPESWKDRVASIFMAGAEQLKIVDPSRRLRYSVAVLDNNVNQAEDELDESESKKPPKDENHKPEQPVKPIAASPQRNVWRFTEANGTVNVETPNPLPRQLWLRLSRYVEMLEPADEPVKEDADEES